MRRERASVSECFVMCAAVLCLAASVLGQTVAPPGKRELNERKPTAESAFADRVEMTTFSADPSQPGPGASVTIKATIKNKSGGTLASIPWRIAVNGQTLGSGTQENVCAGCSFDVSADWTAALGQQELRASADPDNTLTEPAQGRGNNGRVLKFTVKAAEPPAESSGVGKGAPRLDTQVLNYQKAKEAGAQFNHGIEVAGNCDFIGQLNPADDTVPGGRNASVIFKLSCEYTGARATPEAFKNFTLKNGWKIKSVDMAEEYADLAVTARWEWRTRPSEGGDNPYMQMHLWGNPLAYVKIYVKVTIEGPAGTNPYHN